MMMYLFYLYILQCENHNRYNPYVFGNKFPIMLRGYEGSGYPDTTTIYYNCVCGDYQGALLSNTGANMVDIHFGWTKCSLGKSAKFNMITGLQMTYTVMCRLTWDPEWYEACINRSGTRMENLVGKYYYWRYGYDSLSFWNDFATNYVDNLYNEIYLTYKSYTGAPMVLTITDNDAGWDIGWRLKIVNYASNTIGLMFKNKVGSGGETYGLNGMFQDDLNNLPSLDWYSDVVVPFIGRVHKSDSAWSTPDEWNPYDKYGSQRPLDQGVRVFRDEYKKAKDEGKKFMAVLGIRQSWKKITNCYIPHFRKGNLIYWDYLGTIYRTNRRPNEGEFRAFLYLAVASGAQGIGIIPYPSWGTFEFNYPEQDEPAHIDSFWTKDRVIGLIDFYGNDSTKGRRPFAPEGSIPGYNGPYNPGDSIRSDSIYYHVMRVMKEFNNVAPVFADLELYGDPEENGFFFDTIPNSKSWCFVDNIWGVGSKELKYAQCALYKDPVRGRNYVMIVNRHCDSDDDRREIAFHLNKNKLEYNDNCEHTYMIDMGNYKSRNLSNGDILGARYGAGEGKLWAVVTDEIPPVNRPWGAWAIIILKDEKGNILDTVYNVPSYDEGFLKDKNIQIKKKDKIKYEIKLFVRGELFKNGPRARDVNIIKIRYPEFLSFASGDNFNDCGNEDDHHEPTFLVSTPIEQDCKIKEKVYNEDVNYEYIDLCEDTCYVFSFTLNYDNPIYNFGETYYLSFVVEEYNYLWNLIDREVFYLTPASYRVSSTTFPKPTGYYCQKGDPDPLDKWYIGYTGTEVDTVIQGGDTTVVVDTVVKLLTVGGGGDEVVCSGKYPSLVVSGDTVGISYLSKGVDSLLYRYKVDSVWSAPYLIAAGNKGDISVPRTDVYNGEVYVTFATREESGLFMKTMGYLPLSGVNTHMRLYYAKFNIKAEQGEIGQISEWTENIENMEPYGAGVEVDNMGNVCLSWREIGGEKYGVMIGNNIIEGKVTGVGVAPGPKDCILSYGGMEHGFVPGKVYVDGNSVVMSLFNVGDTVEIERDTLYQGDDIRGVKMVGAHIIMDQGGQMKFYRYNFITRGISEVKGLTDDSILSYGGEIDGISYYDGEKVVRTGYMIWTEMRDSLVEVDMDSSYADTFYTIGVSVERYEEADHYGCMPYVYIKGGISSNNIFTEYRDDYVEGECDRGDDSLVYKFPVRAGEKKRMVLEFFTSDTSYDSTVVRCEINGEVIGEYGITGGEVEREDFWISDSLCGADTLRVVLRMMSGDSGNHYIPLSRLITESYEVKEDSGSASSSGKMGKAGMPAIYFYKITPTVVRKAVKMRYYVKEDMRVKIRIYDVTGRVIKVIEDGEVEPGMHEEEWNLLDKRGREVGRGIYFIKFEAGDYEKREKVVVLK